MSFTQDSVQINKNLQNIKLRFALPGLPLAVLGAPAAFLSGDVGVRGLGYFLMFVGLILCGIFGVQYLAIRRTPLFSVALSDAKNFQSEMKIAIKSAIGVKKIEMKKVAAANTALSVANEVRAKHATQIENNEIAIKRLLDEKGEKVRRAAGGITIYERWIATPEISGSIIGVKASSEDNTSLSKRITATRLLTIGVFALAAQKSKAQGEAYCVFDGPEVAGVIVIPANKNIPAGPLAAKIATQINVLEKKAAIWASTKDSEVERLRSANAALRAQEVAVQEDSEYRRLVSEIDPLYLSKVSTPN
jgi:hypothetical protein